MSFTESPLRAWARGRGRRPPAPGAESTQTRPPRLSTIFFTIESPIPAPSTWSRGANVWSELAEVDRFDEAPDAARARAAEDTVDQRFEALHAAAQEVHALALVLAQPALEILFHPEREVGDPAERRPEIVRRDVRELIELPGTAFERGGEGRALLLEALALDLGGLQGEAKALLGIEPGALRRLFGRARVD